jgi:hypothetical protein
MRSQVETRWPRPTPPSRVNGSLGIALARSTFSLRSLSVRIGDPIRALPRLRFFRDAPSRETNEASAVSPTHEAQHVPPILAVFPRASFETRHLERRERLRSRNRPSTGGAVSSRRPLRPRSFVPLRTRSHATLAISPDELDPDTLRHRRMTTRDGSSLASSPPT